MELAAATHFSQGWPPAIAAPARGIGVAIVRDELNWTDVERRPGEYRFEGPRSLHPQWLAARGIESRLVFPAYGNPLYDDGHTPHSPEGLRAFAAFVAAALRRFPEVRVIEIGNEFNAQNFVSGPVRDRPYAERASLYAALLCAVAERVRPEFPGVTIIGGAAHSVPVEYLRATFAAGALACSDGIAVHPYTSPPEQLASHLALLRAAMGDAPQPIHASEFGREGPDFEATADYLLRMVAVMAADGVASATWYALREQPWNKGMELLTTAGAPRPAGAAFALAQRLLSFGPVRRIESDAFTHLYLFGDRALVAWGAPRSLAIDRPVGWLDSRGAPRPAGPVELREDAPVVAIREDGGLSTAGIALGPQRRIADSFFQFDATNGGGPGRWSWLERRGDGAEAPLETMGGGEVQAEGWRPYLGGRWRRPLGVTETTVTSADFGAGADPARSFAVVERFAVAAQASAALCAMWRVAEGSGGDVAVAVRLNGATLGEVDPVRGEARIAVAGLALAAGDVLDFEIRPTAPSHGAGTVERRFSISVATPGQDGCPPPEGTTRPE